MEIFLTVLFTIFGLAGVLTMGWALRVLWEQRVGVWVVMEYFTGVHQRTRVYTSSTAASDYVDSVPTPLAPATYRATITHCYMRL